MCDKTMEDYKPNMFQLQCLKALEIQIEEGKGYNEAEIGRKMQVNRSTISRCFKRYREEGFLEDKEFTRKGKEFLEYYKMIEADLYHYFASIGINEQQQRQAVNGMFDTADIDTIQKLCQKEKMHLKYESIGKNESKEITKMTYEQLCSSLKKGIYQVAFSIYRQGKDWQSLSMADQGFEKPAYLHLKGDKNYLELAAIEKLAQENQIQYISFLACREQNRIACPLEKEYIDFVLNSIIENKQYTFHDLRLIPYIKKLV